MDLVIHGLVCLFFLACTPFPLCRAQQTFFPVSVPLAVRSPYLLSYLSTQNGSLHSNLRPHTLGIDEIGWNGLVKIDNGTTYLWLGDSRVVTGTTNTVLRELTVTPTRTIFTIDAGPLELNITFLSPIEPGDFVKQSIPFSYLSFEARSTDGSPHHVQVYTGITGEWLDPDHSQNHTWTTAQTSNGSQIHSFQHATPREFTENVGLASWGTQYYATRQGSGVTYRIGMAEPNPALFLAQGSLDNSVDPGSPRIIQGGNINYTSLTFAHDLGTIQSTSTPVVWAIGATFDSDSTAAALYQDLSGNPAQRRSLYYVSQYSDDHTLIDDFLNDYPAALDRSIKLDANLTSAASAIVPGSNYSDIIALASRQVLGATWLTISKGSDGSWNTSDVLMYWRDQGAGPPDQLNPPDGLYASFPLFLYLDPSFGAPLLEPLLRFQASSAYTNPYAAASVGGQWPNMTASNTLHSQGIEQSANMVILSYAQARSAGDTSLVSRHYQLLKSWTDYIINPTVSTTAVFNNGQMSADGLNIANQTNLAIKGIIAVKAMSMLASLTGNSADATTYLNKSQDLYTQWKSNAFASDGHMLLAYGDDTSSFSLGYNIFADLWLGTGVVDSGVTSVLSGQVNNLFSFSPQTSQYGVAIDSTAPDKVRSSWNMFIAAAVNDTKTRSAIISRVHARASLNSTADILQFPLDWSSTNASGIFAPATPRLGAVFAPLVLSTTSNSNSNPNSTANNGSSSNASSKASTSAIVGGVVGGVGGALLLVGLAFLLWRRRRRGALSLDPNRTSFDGETSMQVIHETSPFVTQENHLGAPVTQSSATFPSTDLLLPSESLSSSTPPSPPAFNQTSALSPKALMELRHATRIGSSSLDARAIPPGAMRGVNPASEAGSSGSSQSDGDARYEELRRELNALRERVEPPPSYVDG